MCECVSVSDGGREGGWEGRRTRRRSGYRTKIKNPTRQCGEKIKVGQIVDTSAGPVTMESSHFHHRPPHRTKATKCPCTCCTKPDTKYFDPCTSVQIRTRSTTFNISNKHLYLRNISKYIQTRRQRKRISRQKKHFHAHPPHERLAK